ncbi:MAG TPA: hypothetical protein PLF40_17790, partial [Kofleriaceae bacterium]|nr:hypothetical protein [Kofleriaceae bacterium]
MSTRTRIAALALVNWKGVFYERYLLDQHVTALEGANGAGKTTVMIAAYIALLPDLTRLRFTNVGETGASGGDRGIWGRLGEPGRPSYTVLDLRVADGSRYIAAVRLTRASEPTLEVTAMGIEGVPDHVPLSAIFLVRHEDSDVVPDLDEIKHNVKNVGGKVTVFRAVKDYFAELFERGISPLRLLSDDDRAKFNDMLRTSMTGGISRSLTTELRGFVLKEESGMSDTLGRMKANLEACRRTRIEVAETRVLEEELAGIFEAGQAMYLAYASSLQVQAEAAHTAALADAAKRNDLAQHLREVAEAQSHTERQSVHLTKAAQAARNDQERILTQWERLKSAAGLRAKLGTLDEELAVLEHRAAGARAAHEAAQLERVASRQDREQAQAAYERAALGLAELQRGVDELHLRAAEHRRYRHSWAIANELLGREVPMDTASETLIAIRQQCLAMGAERAEIERLTMDGERRASNFERATGALAVLEAGLISMGVDTGPASDNLETRAHVALDQLRLLDLQYGARNELVERLSETLVNVERQQQARQRAAALDLPSVRTAAALASRLEATEQDHKTATAIARHTERRIDE